MVLIETYWNVKLYSQLIPRQTMMVLIETYWNVKSVGANICQIALSVLIETYWNVKGEKQIFGCISGACINRNILECKAEQWADFNRGIFVLIETYWNVKLIACSSVDTRM